MIETLTKTGAQSEASFSDLTASVEVLLATQSITLRCQPLCSAPPSISMILFLHTLCITFQKVLWVSTSNFRFLLYLCSSLAPKASLFLPLVLGPFSNTAVGQTPLKCKSDHVPLLIKSLQRLLPQQSEPQVQTMHPICPDPALPHLPQLWIFSLFLKAPGSSLS